MILLHGLFGSLSNWNGVIRYFENRFNIIVPQLPLYEKYKGDTLEYLMEFLDNLITSGNLQNPILIGNSLGGHLAIRYAHRYPQKVSKLVLTGSSGLYENTQFGSFLKRGNRKYIHERVAYTFYDPAIATDELVDEVMRVTTDNYKCLCAIKAAKSAQRDNVAARLPEISTPVLLIWGNDDRITPPEVAVEFKSLLPKSQLIMLNQCGHAPMMEKPDEFNKGLEPFITV
ncbi:alpha/beta fold hydrolase [Mucilaginibacter celer]|uniref:Alpha/beta fold hydrolase n=1 Tax=Mucilaginibacter celer TaxID=2305508 RepID=A0A494W7I0_9SPHI|nr:alpha/beta fold hydrolase [Mucilaginibacter celer]